MKKLTAFLTFGLAASLALAGCTADPSTGGSSAPAGKGDSIPTQTLNQELHDKLPEKIKSSGTLTNVNVGSFPPYTIVDASHVTGAMADMTEAIAQLLGVKIEHKTVDGLASVLAGMETNRYDLDLGPNGDFLVRQKQATFIDWVNEHVVFAVQKGNPAGIDGIASVCGKKIAVQAAGSAEKVVKAQSDKCVEEGKDAVDVQSYKDQPSSILAVQSKRADAFFSSQAPLTYFVNESNGALELAGVGDSNGFGDLFQGAMVPKDSPLAEILLESFKILNENGTYASIMKKWDLENNMISEPGINLGAS